MSTVESLRVTSQGFQTTVELLQDHLNSFGSGQRLSNYLKQLADHDGSTAAQLNLDLGRVERLTSAGLNELIGINSQARNFGIRLVLLDVQESVREVFALTRLERMFEFHHSSEAIAD